MFYIYVHHKPDGTPFYVGKGKGARSRDFRKRNPYHNKIVAKYGVDNIQVSVIPCESEEDAFDKEIEIIKTFRELGFDLANMTDGGEGLSGAVFSEETRAKMSVSFKSRTRSAEHCAKISAAKKGKKFPYSHKGRTLSAEHRAKISAAGKGRNQSEETRAKISAAGKGRKFSAEQRASLKGRTFSAEHRANLSASLKGRTCSEETRAKISATTKGRTFSAETRAKISASLKARKGLNLC